MFHSSFIPLLLSLVSFVPVRIACYLFFIPLSYPLDLLLLFLHSFFNLPLGPHSIFLHTHIIPVSFLAAVFPLSLFLPSGDAAKRKAWKLNRVSSLRSIYTNSLQNSEGKKKNLLWWDGQTPNWPPPWPSHHCRVGVPCAGDLCFWFQEWMSWWFAEKDDETGFESLTCLSKKHWDTFITWRLIL